jgi:ligand-binding sensor domain-containing protein
LLSLTGRCFINTTTAQHFAIKKYTVNDGLADSYIVAVCQDSQGFLWVGTVNGLSRFDGKEFINYGYAEGLPNLVVDVVYEDRLKRLWVGTRKGIVEIKGGSAVAYPVDDGQVISFVFNIQESASNELWALTNKGVYRFSNNQWKKLRLYPGLENHPCRSIIETPNGLQINYGDYLVQKKSNNNYQVLGKHMQQDPYYNKLIRFNDLTYLSLPNKLLQVLPAGDTVGLFEKALRKKNIGCFFRDSRGRFWINTEQDGLLVSSKNNTQLITDTVAVAYNLVSKIYEDREGNIWVAAFDGLIKIREVNYNLFQTSQYPLLTDVRNLVKTAGNTVLACTQNGLLPYRDQTFHQRALLPVSRPAALAFPGIIDSWCNDDQGRMWLVTRERKLLLLEKNVLKDVTAVIHYKGDNYWRIAFNKRDKKVYLTCGDTLLCGNEQGLHPFKAANGRYIIKPRSIYSFTNGCMLVSVTRDKFLLIDTGNNVRDVTAAIGSVEANADVLFCETPAGKYWMANKGGLVRFFWDQQQLPVKELRITTSDGMPNDAVYAITLDGLGRIWAVTASGLVVIETNQPSAGAPIVHRVSEEMGIAGSQWALFRLLTDGDGFIWMSCLNSVYRFNPRLIQFDNTPPAVAIESIQLNLQPTKWHAWTDSLYGYRQLPLHTSLPYNLNNLSIAYRAPCFSGSSGIVYAYQLEGADSGWSPVTKSNLVSFVKLPPGNYHFKVRARKSNTGWGEPATFIFTIQKPYWETWAFRILVLAIASVLLGLIFRRRVRQVQRKALVGQQLQELELKALRAQMNPHFIYNALNSIQALVLDNKPEEATRYISKFGRLLRQVLNHSEQNLITLEEELTALELYLQLEQLRLNFDLQFHIQTSAGINPAIEWVPPLILQPIAENAVWHGLSTKKGDKKLDIVITVRDEWLMAEITDNGIGRKQAAAKKRHQPGNVSKGIDITERLIKEYNQAGNAAAIDIIDLYDTAQQPTGTKVIVRIKRKV